jgi:outer membrane protein assembly factor BamB
MHCRRGLAAIVVAAGFVTLSWSQPAEIPKKPLGDDPEPKTFTDGITLPNNREAKSRLQAAFDYAKNERWDVVADTIQGILDLTEDSFLEVRRKDPTTKADVTMRISIRTEANRLLSELPVAALETYEVQFGPKARAKLNDALQNSDLNLLGEVFKCYRHTKAGAEAANLLGTYYLDRGAYQAASNCFEALLTRRDADKLPPAVLFKAALALRRAGETQRADVLWQRVAEKAERGELTIDKQPVTVEALRREYDKPAGLPAPGVTDWAVFRGSANRTAQGVGGTPFLERRWTMSLFLPDQDEQDKNLNGGSNDWLRAEIQRSAREADAKMQIVLPTFFPVAAAGRLMYRTYDGVHAVMLRDDQTIAPALVAGEVAWRTPSRGSLHELAGTGKRDALKQLLEGYRQSAQNHMLVDNPLLGTLSHDGQRVFFVEEMGLAPSGTSTQQAMMNGQQPNYGVLDDYVRHNRLKAIEIESGKELWTLGGRRTNKDPENRELLDAYFLGAPLPLAGKIYCLVEARDGELTLVCIDPSRVNTIVIKATGKDQPSSVSEPEVMWKQPLGTANNKLPGDHARRTQGVHLAHSDGILICPTNAGVLLGVDLLTRSLVWAHSYREPVAVANLDGPAVRPFRAGVPQPTTGIIPADRWRTAPPAVVHGRVLFTAYDSNSLQCLDLRDGRLIWKITRTPDDLFFAGVYNGKAVVVGKNHLRAYDALANKDDLLWRCENTGTPAGQGVASDNVYYLPVRAAAVSKEPEVCAIDLNTGKVLAHTKSRQKDVPGNLIFYEGEVYAQSALEVVAYPQLKVKLAEMDRLLAANPKDPVGLTERGELRLDKGERKDAIADLQLALEQKPTEVIANRAKAKLYDALTELFQTDFATAEAYLKTYADLCDLPEPSDPNLKTAVADERQTRQANYLCLLAKGREQQGRLLEAFQAYLDFSVLTGNRERISVIDEPNTQARPDVWARGRISAMLQKATAEQRKPLEERLLTEWNLVRGADDLDKLRRFVTVFGSFLSVGQQARMLLAEKLVLTDNEDDSRDAQILFNQLAQGTDATLAAQAIEALARLMTRKGLLEDAVSFYQKLGRDYAQTTVRDGKVGADYITELLTDKRFLPYLESLPPVWQGRLKAQLIIGNSNVVLSGSEFTLEPVGEVLPFFRRHRLVVETPSVNTANGQWTFKIVHRTNHQEYAKFPGLLGNPQLIQVLNASQLAQVHQHIVVLNLGHMIYVFDAVAGKKLWERNLLGRQANQQISVPQVVRDQRGGMMLLYSDGWTQRLGQLGVIEAGYVCLQTREGLVALDPIRGTEIWTKTDIAPRTQIFGDAEYVFVVEQNADGAPVGTRVLRAADGVVVKAADFRELFDPTKRKWIDGRRLLIYETAGANHVLRFHDLVAGRDEWRRTYDTPVALIQGDDPSIVGVANLKTGDFEIYEARTNRVLYRGQFARPEHLEKVNEIRLLMDGERYYLALNRPPANPSSNLNVSAALRPQRINGTLYAFDRVSNELQWFVEERLLEMYIIVDQFSDLPAIFVTGQASRVMGNITPMARVTVLDKRTGKLLYDQQHAGTGSFFMSLKTNPAERAIEFIRSDLRIRVTADPKDPLQLGAAQP